MDFIISESCWDCLLELLESDSCFYTFDWLGFFLDLLVFAEVGWLMMFTSFSINVIF